MLLIEWKASADADLFEILDYISERNEQAAERLYGLIEGTLEHASEHPLPVQAKPAHIGFARDRGSPQLHCFVPCRSNVH